MSTPPSAGSPEGSGLGERAGEAAARGLGVALLVAVPAGLRTAGAGGSFLDGLLIAAGVLLPFITTAILLSRAAGRGFRYLSARRSPRAIVLGLALWIGLSSAPIAWFGSVLKETTSHRGLGGATFGAFGLAILILAALAAFRLVALGDVLVTRGARPRLVAGVGAAIAVVPMLLSAAPLGMRGGGEGEAAVRAAILDGAILLVATALAASLDLGEPARRLARFAGVPLSALVLVASLARLWVAPSVGQAVRRGGGLAATMLWAVDGWRASGAAGPSSDAATRRDTSSERGSTDACIVGGAGAFERSAKYNEANCRRVVEAGRERGGRALVESSAASSVSIV